MKRLNIIFFIFISLFFVGCKNDGEETLDNDFSSDRIDVLAVEAQENPVDPEGNEYVYRDFIGYYLHYDTIDRAHANMVVTIGQQYLTLGLWNSENEVYEILDYSINENVLTINFSMFPYGEEEPLYGTMEIYLFEENEETRISFGNDLESSFYGTTLNGIESFGYILQEDILKDIKN